MGRFYIEDAKLELPQSVLVIGTPNFDKGYSRTATTETLFKALVDNYPSEMLTFGKEDYYELRIKNGKVERLPSSFSVINIPYRKNPEEALRKDSQFILPGFEHYVKSNIDIPDILVYLVNSMPGPMKGQQPLTLESLENLVQKLEACIAADVVSYGRVDEGEFSKMTDSRKGWFLDEQFGKSGHHSYRIYKWRTDPTPSPQTHNKGQYQNRS